MSDKCVWNAESFRCDLRNWSEMQMRTDHSIRPILDAPGKDARRKRDIHRYMWISRHAP
jgi:hypothetical protein